MKEKCPAWWPEQLQQEQLNAQELEQLRELEQLERKDDTPIDHDGQVIDALRAGGGGESYGEFCSLFSSLGESAELAELDLACPAGIAPSKTHVLRFTQTEEALEVVVAGTAVVEGQMKCDIGTETLAIWSGPRQLIDGRLHVQVKADDCSWSVQGDALKASNPAPVSSEINLIKVKPAYWKSIWTQPGQMAESLVQPAMGEACTDELQTEALAEGVHCGGDMMTALPSQQFDNFVDFEERDSADQEDSYLQACSLGGAADSDDSDPMDTEMERIGEQLLAQTAINASKGPASCDMPLPVDRRKAAKPLDWGAQPIPAAQPEQLPKAVPAFKRGDKAVLYGLESQPDLNGKDVTVLAGADPTTGRLPIRVNSSKQKITVLPNRLKKECVTLPAAQVGCEFKSQAEATAVRDAEAMARRALVGYDAEAPECVLEESDGAVIRTDMAGGLNTETDCFPGEIPDLDSSTASPPKGQSPFGPGYRREEDIRIRQQCLLEEQIDDVSQRVCSPDADASDEVHAFAIDPEFDYDNVDLEPMWK